MNIRLASSPWQNRANWSTAFLPLLFCLASVGIVPAATNEAVFEAWARLPRTNLLVYHNRRGELLPVKSKSDWQKRRAEIVRGARANQL